MTKQELTEARKNLAHWSDAPKETREISVTQGMIDTGVRTCCHSCPVAKAVDAELAEGFGSAVTQGSISIFEPGQSFKPSVASEATPEQVVHFIIHFDHFGPVSPFTFPLTLPAGLWKPRA